MISLFSSTTDIIGLQEISTCCLKIFLYFFSHFLTFFSWYKCLKFRLMIMWEIKLIIRLTDFFTFMLLFFVSPFLPILLLCFFNHFFFHWFDLFIKFWDTFININFFMFSCSSFNNLFQLKSFILKLFFHVCPIVLIPRQLIIILKKLFYRFSCSGLCFPYPSLILLLHLPNRFIEIILWKSFVFVNNFVSFFFNIFDKFITPLIDSDEG